MQNKEKLEQEQVLRMSGVNPRKCMRCGKCSATCPSMMRWNTIRISLFIW